MTFDITHYLPYLDNTELSLTQKEEIIRTVWGLLENQVTQAFEVSALPDKSNPPNEGRD